MQVEVTGVRRLLFPDGTPVRAASAIAPLGDGSFVVVQDDATHACLVAADGTTARLRILPQVEGHDVFSSAAGTKHLKPDLEAACPVPGGVLLLGSGSTPARMRSVLLRPDLSTEVRDRSAAYAAVATALDVPTEALNLEGACVVDGHLRWFQRGPAASVAVGLDALDRPHDVRRHDLGRVDGVPLGVTDAVSVGGHEGAVLVAAAAEDTPNPYDDGPVVAAAIALLDPDGAHDVAVLPPVDGRVAKVEGLAVLDWSPAGGRLLAVVDADDPDEPSALLTLRVAISVASSP